MTDVTLSEVLSFREEKAARQTGLLREHPDCTIVSLAMNIPGPRKVSPGIHSAYREGLRLLNSLFVKESLTIHAQEHIETPAGYCAAYAVSGADAFHLKERTARIEDSHPLGRLFDIDVLDSAGTALSRRDMGAAPRKCLLCGNDAKACGRSRAHTVTALEEKVNAILDGYERRYGYDR